MDAALRIPGDEAPPELPAHSEHLGAFLTGDARVHPDDQVQTVAELFFARPDLEAVALVRDGRPEGLLTRGRLLVKLARNFGHELYARKPVTRIADLSPLVLPEDTSLAAAVEQALSRPAGTAFDEVLVVSRVGGYLGHASIRELARQQGLALVPLKDLLFGTAWAVGLFRSQVAWRGNRIVVGPGTRIERPSSASVAAALPSAVA